MSVTRQDITGMSFDRTIVSFNGTMIPNPNPKWQHTVNVSEPITNVNIQTDCLDVEVKRTDSNYVFVDVASDERTKEFILEILKQVTSGTVDLYLLQEGESQKNGKITIGTNYPLCNVTIQTMSGSANARDCGPTQISTMSGSASLKNCEPANVSTMSGSAFLYNCGRTIVKTMSGSAQVTNSVGRVDINTMSGSAHATNCNGPTHISTMSGSILLNDCGEPNYANSLSGYIHVEGGLRGGKATSRTGSVHVD